MKKTNLLWSALAVLGLVLWGAGIFTAQRAGSMTGTVSARWQNGGVSPAQLVRQEALFRQEGVSDMPEATLWEEIPSAQVSDGKYNKADVTVLRIFGSAEDICQNNMLAGGFPARGDVKGCTISEKTAFDLWGNTDVLGKAVYWDDTVYYVYGVVEGNDDLLLVQTDSAGTETLPYMQLRFSDGGGREEAESYLLKAGFMNAQILDLPLLGWFLKLLAFIPVFLLGGSILIKLISRAIKLRAFSRLLLTYLPPAIAAGAVCLTLIGRMETIPARLIPGRWSSFEFWGELFGAQINNVKAWLSFPSGNDMTLWGSVLATAFIILVTLMLMTAALSRIKIRNARSCVVGALACIGAVFVMALFYSGAGGVGISISVWLMPVLWILTDYGLYLHRRLIRPKGGGVCDREIESAKGENDR